VYASLHAANEHAAARQRAEFVAFAQRLLRGPPFELPTDPTDLSTSDLANAASLCLACQVESNDGSECWWFDAVDSVSREWAGWKFDFSSANEDATRGCWLTWVGFAACNHMVRCHVPGWARVRNKVLDALKDRRDEWLFDVPPHATSIRRLAPVLALRLVLLEPRLDVSDWATTFVPYMSEPWSLREAIGLARDDVQLEEQCRRRLVLVEAYRAAMAHE
jgi:hypothetical protein